MTTPLAFALEQAFAAATRLDPELAARFRQFAGRRVSISLRGVPATVFQCSGSGTWRAATDDSAPADLVIRASLPAALALPTLVRSGADLGSYRRAGIEFEGDLELARALRRTVASFTFDWEELLSRAVGSLMAHRIGNGVRACAAAMAAAHDSAARNAAEQLQYGLALLPARAEVEAFLRDVDHLRSDVDRLAARVRILAEEDGASV
ncbi:MAG: ubiquinone biosynthesis accessory factor UbiJ [Acidiferrobacteraceae bacterium]